MNCFLLRRRSDLAARELLNVNAWNNKNGPSLGVHYRFIVTSPLPPTSPKKFSYLRSRASSLINRSSLISVPLEAERPFEHLFVNSAPSPFRPSHLQPLPSPQPLNLCRVANIKRWGSNTSHPRRRRREMRDARLPAHA